jgi:hypothetical protein
MPALPLTAALTPAAFGCEASAALPDFPADAAVEVAPLAAVAGVAPVAAVAGAEVGVDMDTASPCPPEPCVEHADAMKSSAPAARSLYDRSISNLRSR